MYSQYQVKHMFVILVRIEFDLGFQMLALTRFVSLRLLSFEVLVNSITKLHTKKVEEV